MPAASPLNPLSEQQQNICEYGGAFGVLIALTCLIQHLVVIIPTPETNPMIIFYLFTMTAFFLLALKRAYAPPLVIVSAFLSLVVENLWMMHYSYSLVVLGLLLYHAVILILLYAEKIPQKLKQKQLAEKAEKDKWAGKI